MYCKKCGKENERSSKFCVECGTELKEKKKRAADPSVTTGWKVLNFALPLVFLVGAGVFLFLAYEKEKGINEDTLAWQEQMAEAVTEEGDLEKAVSLNERTLAARPKEEAFQEDKEQLEKVMTWHDDQKSVIDAIDELEFEKAEKGIEDLSVQADALEASLSDIVSASLKKTETSLFLAKTKEEIKGMDTVEQLGSKLSAVGNYEGEESEKLADNIRSKLETISYEDATQELTNGNMDGAEEKLYAGMEYVPESEKLLALQDEVEKQRLAAQQAEQERREQQLKQAAAEERKNQTGAADVTAVDAAIDAAGDLNIDGQVKNNGTASISSIEVTLAVYEEETYLGETTLFVTPYSLAPGETGSFFDYYIGPFVDVEVEVIDVTWYVN